jgi:glycosyltransferase involved in cell wall biosynthesis
MRILTCCYEYPPIGGGGAKVVQGLTDELARQGHTVDIVTMCYGRLPLDEHRGRVTLYRVPGVRRKQYVCTAFEMIPYILHAVPAALRLARSNRYDINHTHFIFPDGIVAWFLYRRVGLPYIITVHGSDVPGYNPHRFTWAHRLLVPLWRIIVRHAKCVVCPSRTLETLVKKVSPDANTVVIPNGFDPSRFSPALPKNKDILCVTRMLERKGVQYFIKAIQGMNLDGGQVHIVGDGPYLPALKELARETGVEAIFHGFMDNNSPELKKLLEESGIFVFVSEAENFPIVLLEAMAAGAAIITTRDTGCEEVVGEAAVLVAPCDVAGLRGILTKLIKDTALRTELSKSARTRVSSLYAWQKVAKAYENCYKP